MFNRIKYPDEKKCINHMIFLLVIKSFNNFPLAWIW
jgi:hypothetical protein